MVDTVTIPQQNTGAPEGHDAKMAQMGAHAVDGGAPQVPATPPATPAAPAAQTPPPATPAEPNPPATPDAADEALKGTGLELTSFQQEFSEKGALSPESYEKLAKAGIPKEIVDSYIEGQKAVAQGIQAEAHALVGGAEQYASMVQWAGTALTAADKAAFNQAIEQGGSAAKLAIAGLNAQFKSAQGSAPQLLNGFAQSGAEAVSGFRSTHELTTAMSDPRYSKDAAYRKDVEARLAVSKLF